MKPGQNFSPDVERWGRNVSRHFFSERRKRLVTMNLRVLSLLPAASHNAPQFSCCSLSCEPLLNRSFVNPERVTDNYVSYDGGENYYILCD